MRTLSVVQPNPALTSGGGGRRRGGGWATFGGLAHPRRSSLPKKMSKPVAWPCYTTCGVWQAIASWFCGTQVGCVSCALSVGSCDERLCWGPGHCRMARAGMAVLLMSDSVHPMCAGPECSGVVIVTAARVTRVIPGPGGRVAYGRTTHPGMSATLWDRG